MSIELSVLSEVWEIVRPYITAKDRVDVAEQLVRTFDHTAFMEPDSDQINGVSDRALRAALKTHYDADDEDDSEEWDE